MTGPVYAPRSAGSPTTSSAARAASRSTSSSCTESSTIAREQALHFWPEKPYADEAMPAAAASTSALSLTIAGFLPPISVIAGRAKRPSWKRRPSDRPTAAEPVKTTPSIAPADMPVTSATGKLNGPNTPNGRSTLRLVSSDSPAVARGARERQASRRETGRGGGPRGVGSELASVCDANSESTTS